MNPPASNNRKGKFIRRAADCGMVLLILLAIGLPLYIKWSGSKLSYTPEPQFPSEQTIKK
ncbi:MAG: hypothetical protein RL380_1161 [Verrucomicrobiota bacterium]|jgi:hypothetical protein